MVETNDLRAALVARIGQPLTPELAAAIEMDARSGTDRTIDGDAIAPRQSSCRRYMLWIEALAHMAADLRPLMLEQYAETEAHRNAPPAVTEGIGLGCAWERQGRTLHATARDSVTGELAGYMRVFIGTSHHTGARTAIEDGLYVRPSHRKWRLGTELVLFMERVCRDLGITQMQTETKLFNRAGRLYERLGYQPLSQRYTKNLGA